MKLNISEKDLLAAARIISGRFDNGSAMVVKRFPLYGNSGKESGEIIVKYDSTSGLLYYLVNLAVVFSSGIIMGNLTYGEAYAYAKNSNTFEELCNRIKSDFIGIESVE